MPKPGEVISQCTGGMLIFWCPGCFEYHGLWVVEPNPTTGAKWAWNKDFVKPTATPSVHIKGGQGHKRCHFYIRDGNLEYLADCEHHLAGKTVPMQIEEERRAERTQ